MVDLVRIERLTVSVFRLHGEIVIEKGSDHAVIAVLDAVAGEDWFGLLEVDRPEPARQSHSLWEDPVEQRLVDGHEGGGAGNERRALEERGDAHRDDIGLPLSVIIMRLLLMVFLEVLLESLRGDVAGDVVPGHLTLPTAEAGGFSLRRR